MDFFINRNSTLPYIKMKLITDNDIDYEKFNDMLKNAAVTFSMVSVDNKTFKIANKQGYVVIEKQLLPNKNDEYIYYIEYRWDKRDVDKTGTFNGEFKIDFLEPYCGSLIVPIKEKLYIHIQDSITKTEIVR